MRQREWQGVFRDFAKKKHTPCEVTMTRQGGDSLTLRCRLLTEEDYDQVRAFELAIMDGIPNNDTENIYQPFDESGLRKALGTGWAVGLYAAPDSDKEVCVVGSCEQVRESGDEVGGKSIGQRIGMLAAFLYVIPRPEFHHNVLADVALELGLQKVREDGTVEYSEEVHDVMIADCILVGRKYRGYGLQRALFYLADRMAAQEGVSRLCGTASPKNAHSIRNFEAAGYQCVAVKPKYQSERCFFVKDIMMSSCHLCPRDCGVDRTAGQRGRCGMTDHIMAARAALHMWEEPCISGEEGSGTVFFSGCSLGCVFCQNHEIALGDTGKEITVERLAEIYLELQTKGANNINLVTAGHFLPQVIRSLRLAKKQGLHIPIVYNTGGYEKVEAIRMLEGLVDIYLPDLKYVSSQLSARYSGAPDYFAVASAALEEMVRQTGPAVFDERDMLVRGTVVRHLLLPGCLEDSKAVIRYLYETYGDQIYISIMNQYTPLPHVKKWPEIDRRVTEEEYDELVDYAIDLGVENGFIQEGETAEESFIPAFDIEGV